MSLRQIAMVPSEMLVKYRSSGGASLEQVEVDLALNAHANARWHHELRKKHLGKLRKTLDANAKAFKAAEKRTNTQLVKVQELCLCNR